MAPTDAPTHTPRRADVVRAWIDLACRHGGGSALAPDCGKLRPDHEQTETRDRSAFPARPTAAPNRPPRRGGAGVSPRVGRDAIACRDPSHAGRTGLAMRAA